MEKSSTNRTMLNIFIYYIIGLAIFLMITYLCVQIGWLFEGEGKIHFGGLIGLCTLLLCIFIFITVIGSVQLSGWTPTNKKIDIPSIKEGSDFKGIFDHVKGKFKGETEEKPAEEMGEFFDDVFRFEIVLPKMQGATAVQLLVQDISSGGFMNRINPLTIYKTFRGEKKEGVEAEALYPPSVTQKEKEDQAAFKMRIHAIEEHFSRTLRIPDSVLPEQLRRIEEVYIAITQGRTEYPYARYEFPLPREQALRLLVKYEQDKTKEPASIKLPVEIEIFGERFDLGVCSLSFPGARVEPPLEKVKYLAALKTVKISFIPIKHPGKIVAVYEKFKPSGEAGETSPPLNSSE